MAFTGLDPTRVVAVQNVQEKIRLTTKMCRRTTIAFMYSSCYLEFKCVSTVIGRGVSKRLILE